VESSRITQHRDTARVGSCTSWRSRSGQAGATGSVGVEAILEGWVHLSTAASAPASEGELRASIDDRRPCRCPRDKSVRQERQGFSRFRAPHQKWERGPPVRSGWSRVVRLWKLIQRRRRCRTGSFVESEHRRSLSAIAVPLLCLNAHENQNAPGGPLQPRTTRNSKAESTTVTSSDPAHPSRLEKKKNTTYRLDRLDRSEPSSWPFAEDPSLTSDSHHPIPWTCPCPLDGRTACPCRCWSNLVSWASVSSPSVLP